MNQLFAERAWPDLDPLGRQVEFDGDLTPFTIVGVVDNTQPNLSGRPLVPQVFSVFAQDFSPDVRIAAKQAGTSADFVARMREAVLSVDPSLALAPTQSLESVAGLGMLPRRITALTGSALGLLALLLSTMGVYGVVAYIVSQRTKEIGVRMALGANRREVMAGVVCGGLSLALPGLGVGLVLAVLIGRLLQSFLMGVSPLDPVALGMVGLLFVLVVSVACLVPAVRAAAVEPASALRYD